MLAAAPECMMSVTQLEKLLSKLIASVHDLGKQHKPPLLLHRVVDIGNEVIRGWYASYVLHAQVLPSSSLHGT